MGDLSDAASYAWGRCPGDGEVLRPVGTHAILKADTAQRLRRDKRTGKRGTIYGDNYGGLYGNAGFA